MFGTNEGKGMLRTTMEGKLEKNRKTNRWKGKRRR